MRSIEAEFNGAVDYAWIGISSNGRFDLGDIRSYLLTRAGVTTVAPAQGQVTRTLRLPRLGPGGIR